MPRSILVYQRDCDGCSILQGKAKIDGQKNGQLGATRPVNVPDRVSSVMELRVLSLFVALLELSTDEMHEPLPTFLLRLLL